MAVKQNDGLQPVVPPVSTQSQTPPAQAQAQPQTQKPVSIQQQVSHVAEPQTQTPAQQTQTQPQPQNGTTLVQQNGATYVKPNDPGTIGQGEVKQGGAQGMHPGTYVAQARTPDGRTIEVTYVDGVRQTEIPDGTIVRTAGGDFVYNAANDAARNRGAAPGANVSGIGTRAPNLEPILNRWLVSAQDQANLRADYAVSQGVNELTRAEEDAQEQFKTQRDQISEAEQKALDNQALYNERRGDRGGIGGAQYSSIQNQAAQNMLAVSQAQTKLSTDTARQIADLRAQGEFQKADALLQLTQNYLSQLINLKQWAAEFDLGIEEFNKELEKWNYEFEAEVGSMMGNYRGQRTLNGQELDAQMTGYYNGKPTLAMQQSLAEAGLTLASMGIMPSESQLAAMQQIGGYSRGTIENMVSSALLEQQTGVSGGGGGRGSSGRSGSAKPAKAPDVKIDPVGWLYYYDISDYESARRALLRQGFDDDDAEYYAGELRKQMVASYNTSSVNTRGRESNKSTLSYNADEGTVQWNGRVYGVGVNDLEDLLGAIYDAEDAGQLSSETRMQLLQKLNRYGLLRNN